MRRREADRMLRIDNMVAVFPLTQLSRSLCCNKCMIGESNLKMQCVSQLRPRCVRVVKPQKSVPTALRAPGWSSADR